MGEDRDAVALRERIKKEAQKHLIIAEEINEKETPKPLQHTKTN
jgi:hypothetical protein